MASFTLGEEQQIRYATLGASPSTTVEGWERYARVNRKVYVSTIAQHTPFGKKYYLHDALRLIIEKGWVPANTLESIKIAATQSGNVKGFTSHQFDAEMVRADYYPWDTYINSLNYEYDPEKFLNLLLLHESAGLYAGKNSASLIFDMTAILNDPTSDPVIKGYPPSVNLLGYSGSHWTMFAGKQDPIHWYDYNPMTHPTDGHYKAKDDKLDIPSIAQYQWPEYRGADHAKIAAFLLNLSRFRERVLARVLGQTFFMLDVAKLTDEDTVKTMYQVFTNEPYAIYGKIDKSVYCDISTTGDYRTAPPPYQDWFKKQVKNTTETISWDNFRNVRLRFTGNSGKVYSLSIPDYLKIQFESVIWLLICNLNKLEGRIAQLQDNTAQLKAQSPLPWILDPWENPFLLYDAEMSAKVNKAMFKNKATSAAQQPPELLSHVESVAVPQFYMAQAPAIAARYRRTTQLPGGANVSLDDLTKKNQGFTPAILAAAAAAAIGYLATR